MADSNGMPDPGDRNGGPTMMARIGDMRAPNRNIGRELNPDGKDTHWGKRKPAR
jgi:hypothetical protein